METLIVALIVLSVSMPIMCFFSFSRGFKLGQIKDLLSQVEENNRKLNLFKHKEKPIQETEEQRRQRILDENVESYDGTGKNQQKL